MSLVIAIITFAALAILAGAVLIYIGLRGRRVGDHPFCGVCNHDLFGRMDQRQPCPECGVAPDSQHRIQIGRFQRRRRPLLIAVALLVFAALAVSPIAVAHHAGVNLYAYEPPALLSWLASGPLEGERGPATEELIRRVTNGSISQARIDSLADKLLDHQLKPVADWIPQWGDFLEAAQAANKLSAARWQRYAEQASNFQLVIRSTITRGDPFPLKLINGPTKAGTRNTAPRLWALPREMIASTSIAEKIPSCAGWSLGYSPHISGSSMSALNDGPLLRGLHDGINHLSISVPVDICSSTALAPFNHAPPIATVTKTFDLSVNVLPASRPSVTAIHDASLRDAVGRAVFVNAVMVESSSIKPPTVTLQISALDCPAGISFNIFVKGDDAEQEQPVGVISCPRNSRWQFQYEVKFPSGLPKHIDVLLRPDPKPALSTTDVFEYWGEEIDLKNVPVPYFKF